MNKSILVALLTHGLSKYDVFIFGFMAPVLAPIYFPTNSESISLMIALIGFASGYFVRPIGALILGSIGDRYGRKLAFTLASFITIFSSIIIGFIPSYSAIGITAPIIVLFSRLMQGFSAGGEFSGAAVFIGEHTSKNKQALFTSLVRSVGFIGIIIGTIIASITTSSIMPSWAWRIVFIMSGILSFICFVLRSKMDETKPFLEIQDKKVKVTTISFFILNNLRNSYKRIIIAIMITTFSYVLFYFTTIYFSTFYKSSFSIETSELMLINTAISLLWGLGCLTSGYLADRIGIIKFISYSNKVILIILLPLFLIYLDTKSLDNLFICQSIFSIISCIYFAPNSALIMLLFPVKQRYFCVALSNTIAQAMFGGTTPLICLALVKFLDNDKAFVLWLLVTGLIGLLGLKLSTKYINSYDRRITRFS